MPAASLRVVLVCALAGLPVSLRAQCPDGSPPPCGAPRRVAAAKPVPPPDIATRRRSFLVLPFRNVSRAPDQDWLVEGSPVLLADALGKNDSVRVVPDERLYPALKRAGLTPGGVMDLARVRAIAGETGGWTAVTGEILKLGERLRVSARAFDVVSNAEVLRAVEEAAPGEDVRDVYQRIGTKLIGVAGVGNAGAADLASTTTRSLDAYRAYVRGVGHSNRSQPKQARDAFLEAVKLDSTYAQAYARLAEAEMNADPRQILNQQSNLYRYSAKAMRLAGNLPARDRDLLMSISEILAGRFSSAREKLVGLYQQDSTNVDATEWRASLEFFDPILVPAPGGGERPRGSLNAGLALAKRTIELDPSRHSIYQNLVQGYMLAGGYVPGIVLGYKREAASLAALLSSRPDRTFIPVLLDTIVLIPSDSLLGRMSLDSLTRTRTRALHAAKQWAMQWLAVGKEEAEAHLWASRVHSMLGDYTASLRELETADSLGVETGMENVAARRMGLLAQLKRYADGRRIADSLWRTKVLDAASLSSTFQIEGVAWAFTLFLLDRNYERADTLLSRLTVAFAPAAMSNPRLPAPALATVVLGGAVPQYFSPPTSVRAAMIQQLVEDAPSLPRGSALQRMLPFAVRVIAGDTAVGHHDLLMRLARASDRIAASGDTITAYYVMQEARKDSMARKLSDSLSWFVSKRREHRDSLASLIARMRPGRVVVTDSVATFSWSVKGDSVAWFRPETPIGAEDFLWIAEFTVRDSTYEVLASVERRPTADVQRGTIPEMLRIASRNLHQIVSADSTVPHRNLSALGVSVEPEPGGLRLLLRDQRLLAALRKERPATVRMLFRPCPTVMSPGLEKLTCVDERVTVVYP